MTIASIAVNRRIALRGCLVLLLAGCIPADMPLDSIVLGVQETAEDETASADNFPSANITLNDSEPAELVIDNTELIGYLVQGQPRYVILKCTAHSLRGTVQSVVADFSAVGGSRDAMLKRQGIFWIWSGLVTATIGGSATLYLTATDDNAGTATQAVSVEVSDNIQPVVTNIVVTGELTRGIGSTITVSCRAADEDGTIQSVVADLSAIGGLASQPLAGNGLWWSWTGTVTPNVVGYQTILLTATDNATGVTTERFTTQIRDTPAPQSSPIGQEGDNIALGRPYTWNVAPNYENTLDANDNTQLTDGKYSTGWFWNKPSTVGWRDATVVEITVDLGQVYPIAGASFSTAAGVSGVEWPSIICLLVSDDGENYYHAGELISLSAKHGLPAVYGTHTIHRFETNDLNIHGRFIRFVVANYPYTVVDEIEVRRGPNSMLDTPFQGSPITDMTAYVQTHRVRTAIVRRIVLDAQDVWSQVANALEIDSSLRQHLQAQLALIIDQAISLPYVDPATIQTLLPLNDLHAQVFRTAAVLWRAKGRPDLFAWQTPLWASLSPTQLPEDSLSGVNVALMQGEYRAGAFNLSNASDSDMVVTVRIEGLPEGTNPAYVAVQEVPWTDTRRGEAVAAALPNAVRSPNGYLVSIPSGMTRQVWLTFHPTGIPAGTYHGTIRIDSGTGSIADIPVQMRLSALQFPAQPTLSLGTWDYTDRERYGAMTPQNRSALISHLREHFVDTTWGSVDVLPNPVNFAKLDAWVQRWPDARNYRIFLNAGKTFGGYSAGTASFNAAVAGWISAYVSHWRQLGLNPSQLGLLIVDEPRTPEQSSTIIAWANAIRAAAPEILIWEDPYYADPSDGLAMFAVCDVLCVHRPDFLAGSAIFRDLYRQQHAAGKALEFYSARGPVHQHDPYSYFRLQAWSCWQEGARAMHFWAAADTGGTSSWNEYITKLNYSLLFLDDQTVTGSKQMEAIREGLEDYEYLTMLQHRIAILEAAGSTTPILADAKTLLAAAPERVLTAEGAASIYWRDLKDRTVADTTRVEILDLLEALE